MASFLDPNNSRGLRAKLARGFKGKLLVGVLTRSETNSVDENGIPQTTNTDYRVEGFVDNYSAYYRKLAGIPDNHVNVVLIGGNSDVNPIQGDEVKFPNYPKYKIESVVQDPAFATFECQSYKV